MCLCNAGFIQVDNTTCLGTLTNCELYVHIIAVLFQTLMNVLMIPSSVDVMLIVSVSTTMATIAVSASLDLLEMALWDSVKVYAILLH